MKITVGKAVAEQSGGEAAGRAASPPGPPPFPDVQCDAPELRPHVGKPWFRAYVAARLGFPIGPEADRLYAAYAAAVAAALPPAPADAAVTDEQLSRHTLVCGATGSGKTRLALRLLAGQLKAGRSAVVIDPKEQTVHHVLALAKEADIPASRVSLLWLRAGDSVPGWNPLAADASASATQIIEDFVSVLHSHSLNSWGPRLQDLLTNSLLVVAAHGLSLYELARFLQRDEYREALLRLEPPVGALHRATLAEVREFFRREFDAGSASERKAASTTVLNKVRRFTRSTALQSVLCAERNTLDFSSLWREQRVVIVHLDFPTFGDEGVRVLGGLLAHRLYRTAMRVGGQPGAVPVVLAMDELGISEQFIGGAVLKILAIARSQNLRLLVAAQYLAQLSPEMRNGLLSQTGVQAFFRLGPEDARVVAPFAVRRGAAQPLPPKPPPAPPSRIFADVARRNSRTGLPADYASYAHPVLDGHGHPIRVSEAALRVLQSPPEPLLGLPPTPAGPAGEDPRRTAFIRLLALMERPPNAPRQPDRAYVIAPDSGEPVEIFSYVRGLPAWQWRFTGTAPLQLEVSFPRPRLAVPRGEDAEPAPSPPTLSEERAATERRLMDLPPRTALLRLPGAADPVVMRAVEVPDPPMGLHGYLWDVMRNGQSAREVETAYSSREAAVDALEATVAPPEPPVQPYRPPAGSGRSRPQAPASGPYQAPPTAPPPPPRSAPGTPTPPSGGSRRGGTQAPQTPRAPAGPEPNRANPQPNRAGSAPVGGGPAREAERPASPGTPTAPIAPAAPTPPARRPAPNPGSKGGRRTDPREAPYVPPLKEGLADDGSI